jgi:hypothetical protein
MDTADFRQRILDATLSLLDEPFERWRTHNDKIHTRLFLDGEKPSRTLELAEKELPLLECDLKESYVLITTNQVISIIEAKISSIHFEQIEKFGNEFEADNFKDQPKTNKVALYDKKGNRLVFVIDALHPAYFSKVLIHNLISFKTKGEFSWDGRKNKYK